MANHPAQKDLGTAIQTLASRATEAPLAADAQALAAAALHLAEAHAWLQSGFQSHAGGVGASK
jgi:hypothetical protein